MTSALSKRHQARNERALQDLIKSVPGNERCADCDARNPGWASWNLGIFLCMRCASLHRRLGTHISKVKSLSMDGWSNDQVESMKRTGNAASNKFYNPKNTRATLPIDIDEVDGAMERFIRQKYDQKIYIAGAAGRPQAAQLLPHMYTGGSASSDDHPPPPPPKPGKRFGFGLRSSSSALPLSKYGREAFPPEVPQKNERDPWPLRVNKQSRVFGANIGLTEEGMEWKLITLKDMGFPDNKRNSSILKGLNGDLERAIESLVRLGEGSTTMTSLRSPASATFPSPKPAMREPQPRSASSTPGISIVNPPSQIQPQLRKQSYPMMSSANTDSHQYNPFDTTAQTSAPLQPPLENAFQNMHVTQPLFPNATGGYPQKDPQFQDLRIQQSMTPPVPQLPQQYFQPNQPSGQQSHTYNPFFNANQQPPPPTTKNTYQPPQQSFAPHNPYLPSEQVTISSNPFQNQFATPQDPYQNQMVSPQNIYQAQSAASSNSFQNQSNEPSNPHQTQPVASQNQYQTQNTNAIFSIQNLIPDQTQSQQPQNFWAQQQQQQQQPTQDPSLQFYSNQPGMQPVQTPYSQNIQNPYQPQIQPLIQQQTGRVDKSSILALYNYPQPAAPPILQADNGSNPSTTAPSPQQPVAARPPTGFHTQNQRSVTMPAVSSSGSKNPFTRSTAPTANPPAMTNAGVRHASNDSVESGSLQSGRHSPDAFASLSARFVR